MVEYLRRIIIAEVRRLWPDAPELELRPLVDITKGDLYTDFCLRAAARLKLPPQQIGATLMAALAEKLPAAIELTQGYMYMRVRELISDEGVRATTYDSAEELKPLVILAPYGGQHPLEFLRRLSLAFCQFSMLRRRVACKLYCAAEVFCDGSERVPLSTLLRRVLEQVKNDAAYDSKCIRSWIEQAALENPNSNLIVRLPWGGLARQDFLELQSQLGRHISWWGDERRWQSAVGAMPWCSSVSKWESFHQAALMAYLAGPQMGEDCDAGVARRQERGNYLWQLFSTDLRIRMNLGGKLSSCPERRRTCAALDVSQLDKRKRALLVRTRCMFEFYHRAMTRGEVREFVAALDTWLSEFNCFFNSPPLRQACHHQCLVPLDVEIIAGVCEVVSAIMREWELYQIWSMGVRYEA